MKPYIIICVEKQLNSYVYRVIRIVGLVSKSGFRTVKLAQRNAVLCFVTTHKYAWSRVHTVPPAPGGVHGGPSAHVEVSVE